MADVFEVFNYPHPMTLYRRTDGGYANADGSWKRRQETAVAITGHLVIGPYDENARTNDHIMSGRAKQVGLVVERGEAVLWTSDDARKGDQVEVSMDDAGSEKKTYFVVEEIARPKLITKLTGFRPGRRQLRLKAEAP